MLSNALFAYHKRLQINQCERSPAIERKLLDDDDEPGTPKLSRFRRPQTRTVWEDTPTPTPVRRLDSVHEPDVDETSDAEQRCRRSDCSGDSSDCNWLVLGGELMSLQQTSPSSVSFAGVVLRPRPLLPTGALNQFVVTGSGSGRRPPPARCCCVCDSERHRCSASDERPPTLRLTEAFGGVERRSLPLSVTDVDELESGLSSTLSSPSVDGFDQQQQFLLEPSSAAAAAAVGVPQYKSCPDLLRPCFLNVPTIEYGTAVRTGRATATATATATAVRRQRTASGSQPPDVKPLRFWTLDDILRWLQLIGMDGVSAVLVGYELTGTDLLMWEDETLVDYGIADAEVRKQLLQKVAELIQSDAEKSGKRRCSRKSSLSSRTGRRTKNGALFDTISASGYDRVVTVELPPEIKLFRAFTVARRNSLGLVISGRKTEDLPLCIGDIILEYNGENCLQMAAVDFNLMTSQTDGSKPSRLVVLRCSSDVERINKKNDRDECQLCDEAQTDVMRF